MIMHIDVPAGELPAVVFGAGPVGLDEVVALAARRARPVLSGDPAFAARIEAGAALAERLLNQGAAAAANLPGLAGDGPHELFTYHDIGLGTPFTPEQTRAILAVRLASLCRGQSGVGMEPLRLLCSLLEHDVLPVIPSEGSVGAGGNPIPLSSLAAVLSGEREVWCEEESVPAADALAAAGLRPIRLRPLEGRALANGTCAMTGLACLAAARAESLARLASRITAFAAIALDEDAACFAEALFAARPYRGMARAASWIRDDLRGMTNGHTHRHEHDAIHAAPHVIGVLMDALPWMTEHIGLELNSASGELLVDVEGKRILHGGHFQGGHIVYAMDGMKNAIGKLANLFERQMTLLTDARNNGLLSNLRSAPGTRAAINHGLKALQTSISAWTGEALRLRADAVFSKSDPGTGAARDCLRVIELTEQVAAALVVALRHACALRYPDGLPQHLGAGLRSSMERIAELVPFAGGDRRLDHDLRRLLAVIRYDGAALLCRGAAEAAPSR